MKSKALSSPVSRHPGNNQRPVESMVYKEIDGQRLHLMLCKPDHWTAEQKRAAIVWIHGGGWICGHPADMLPQVEHSADRGAVAFSLNYRLIRSPVHKPDKKRSREENERLGSEKFQQFMNGPSLSDLVKDCEDAIRYLRQNSPSLGIDPNRIVAIGDSAGAHLAACLGTLVGEEARVNAVVVCSAISDMTQGIGIDLVKPSGGFEYARPELDDERMKRARAVSPLFYVSNKMPPFLILAGGRDWLGDQPRRFHAAIQGKGGGSEYRIYPEARHAFIIYGYTATVDQVTTALEDIDRFLKNHGFLGE